VGYVQLFHHNHPYELHISVQASVVVFVSFEKPLNYWIYMINYGLWWASCLMAARIMAIFETTGAMVMIKGQEL